MRGHIKKRATWEYVAELGPQPLQRCPSCHKRFWIKRDRLPCCPLCRGPLEETVTRRQEMKAGFATKREAQEALTTVMASLSSGTYIEPSRMLTSEFLRGEWLPAIRSTIRPTTYLSYEGHIRCHLIPALGLLPLQQPTAPRINALYSRLLTEGRGEGRGGLSPAFREETGVEGVDARSGELLQGEQAESGDQVAADVAFIGEVGGGADGGTDGGEPLSPEELTRQHAGGFDVGAAGERGHDGGERPGLHAWW